MDNSALKKIREKLGHCSLEWSPSFWLDTGSEELNVVLGDQKLGLPYGRITEISGLESQGKTAIVMALAALAQHDGAFVTWDDFETSFATPWAIQRGVIPCPTCKGSGRLEPVKNSTVRKGCKSCNGGSLCQACNGKGKLKGAECRSCEGSGEDKGLGVDCTRFALIQPYIGCFHDDPKNPKKLGEPRLANAEELCSETEQIMAVARKDFDRQIVVVDSIPSMLTEGEGKAGIEGSNMRTKMDLPMFLSHMGSSSAVAQTTGNTLIRFSPSPRKQGPNVMGLQSRGQSLSATRGLAWTRLPGFALRVMVRFIPGKMKRSCWLDGLR